LDLGDLEASPDDGERAGTNWGRFGELLVHAFLGNGVPILSVRDWRRRRPRCLFGSRHSRPLFSRTYAHRPPHRRRAAAAPRSFFESLTACSGSASQAPPSEATAAASLPAPGQAARGASTLPSLAPATEGAAARDVGVDLVLDGFAVDGLAATLAIRGGANTFACLLTPSRFLLASPSSRRLRPRRGGRDG
jgi:hypothetical protein